MLNKTKEDHRRAQELYSAPTDKPLAQEDVDFLIKYINEYDRKDYCIRYSFYKKDSRYNAYIAFTIDSMAHSPRKSGVENMWEIFCTRPICDIEVEEEAQNWGCGKRRFKTFYYKDIETLIEEDLKYGINTPQKFIDECKKRGYTSGRKIGKPKPGGTQLSIFDLLNE